MITPTMSNSTPAVSIQADAGGIHVLWYTDDDNNSGYGSNGKECRWYGNLTECKSRMLELPPSAGWASMDDVSDISNLTAADTSLLLASDQFHMEHSHFPANAEPSPTCTSMRAWFDYGTSRQHKITTGKGRAIMTRIYDRGSIFRRYQAAGMLGKSWQEAVENAKTSQRRKG